MKTKIERSDPNGPNGIKETKSHCPVQHHGVDKYIGNWYVVGFPIPLWSGREEYRPRQPILKL